MHQGELAELQIASRFGYGEKGLKPKVPGGATLVYTVELLTIKPEIIAEDLTPTERLTIGFVYLYMIIFKLNNLILNYKNKKLKKFFSVSHNLLLIILFVLVLNLHVLLCN